MNYAKQIQSLYLLFLNNLNEPYKSLYKNLWQPILDIKSLPSKTPLTNDEIYTYSFYCGIDIIPISFNVSIIANDIKNGYLKAKNERINTVIHDLKYTIPQQNTRLSRCYHKQHLPMIAIQYDDSIFVSNPSNTSLLLINGNYRITMANKNADIFIVELPNLRHYHFLDLLSFVLYYLTQTYSALYLYSDHQLRQIYEIVQDNISLANPYLTNLNT